jgi:membrane protease YdiL (CAAX protease family)
VGQSGWYQASDGRWYRSVTPPAAGYVLAADGRWYPPHEWDEPWRSSRWGLGEMGMAALVYLVVGIAFSLVVAGVLAASDPDLSIDEVEFGPYSIALLVLVNVLAFAGVPWWATRRKGLASLADDFGLRGGFVDAAIGFGLGIGGLIAAGLVSTVIDKALGADESTSNIPVDSLGNVAEFIVFFLAVGVATPIIEELFFRGLVYRSFLKRGARVPAAITFTTLIFVVPHLPAVTDWPGVLSLFAAIAVLGAVFNLACHITDNRLVAPIVAHMVINGTATLVLYLS